MTTLVLLPGMDGTGDLFHSFITHLGKQYKTIIVRYPVDQALDYQALIKFVQQTLPKQEPYIILGESFSGPIALSLASNANSDLKGVILCCSFIKNPSPTLRKLGKLIDLLPFWSPLTKIASHIVLGRFSSRLLKDNIVKSVSQVSDKTMRTRLKSVLDVDASEALTKVKVPILYLRARRDVLVPEKASELISSYQPNVKFVDIEGPHFLLQAAPHQAANAIETFISTLDN